MPKKSLPRCLEAKILKTNILNFDDQKLEFFLFFRTKYSSILGMYKMYAV